MNRASVVLLRVAGLAVAPLVGAVAGRALVAAGNRKTKRDLFRQLDADLQAAPSSR